MRPALVLLLCSGLAPLAARPVAGALPDYVIGHTRRLTFHVSPLSERGGLEAQLRSGLRSLVRQARGARLLKVRAFVVGRDQAETVAPAVAAFFARRKVAAPALTVVIVGALPLAGARVSLESVAESETVRNPHGLAWISGQPASSDKPVAEMRPLIERSLTALRTAHRAAGLEPGDILRLTCFVSSLADIGAVRALAAAAFPRAAANYIQQQRRPLRSGVECETVGRLRSPAREPLKLLNPGGLPKSANYSHIAVIGAAQVVLTSAQAAAGPDDADARAAFGRLSGILRQAGASIDNVAMSSLYPVSPAGSELVRKIRFEFYDKSQPPASTLLLFEGLTAPPRASFAVDVIAPVAK